MEPLIIVLVQNAIMSGFLAGILNKVCIYVMIDLIYFEEV